MSEFLGNTFRTGEPAPEGGAYQLVGDNSAPDERTDTGRVIRLKRGELLPGHPDTNGPTEWRYVRIAVEARSRAGEYEE
ncbi:MAG: YjzC family protein [Chloroflexi bacterium]|nr:YjzC family protein [Chloroflexota bacterium]